MLEDAENVSDMNGMRKAAAFLLALDSDVAANIMRSLNDRELSAVSEEMTQMGEVDPRIINDVLVEFKDGESSQIEPLLEELPERAVGPEKARNLLERIRRRTHRAFSCLAPIDCPAIRGGVKGRASAGFVDCIKLLRCNCQL